MVSRELEKECVVVFDEAHNIDNVCIEALSVNLRKQTLQAARNNIRKLHDVRALLAAYCLVTYRRLYRTPCLPVGQSCRHLHNRQTALHKQRSFATKVNRVPVFLPHLTLLNPQEVNKAQAATRARLDTEYRRLVDNLVEAQQLRGGEEWLSNPTLPEDVVQESMPGGQLFVLGCLLVLDSGCLVKWLMQCDYKTFCVVFLHVTGYVATGPGRQICGSVCVLAVSAAVGCFCPACRQHQAC
jgi:hypothetical protein